MASMDSCCSNSFVLAMDTFYQERVAERRFPFFSQVMCLGRRVWNDPKESLIKIPKAAVLTCGFLIVSVT
jgi:hypothetical protein